MVITNEPQWQHGTMRLWWVNLTVRIYASGYYVHKQVDKLYNY